MAKTFHVNDDAEVFLDGTCLGRHSWGPGTARSAISRRGAKVPLTCTQGRAARRLKETAALLRWRGEYGVISEHEGAMKVVANALSVLSGTGIWRADVLTAVAYLGDVGGDTAGLAGALWAASLCDRLLPDDEAGRLLGLVLVELRDIQARGLTLTMHPVDETAEDRALRRIARKRETAAARMRAYWVRKRGARAGLQPANSLSSGNATNPVRPFTPKYRITGGKRAGSNVAFRTGSGCDLVAAAVAAGAKTPPDIAGVTSLNATAIRVALCRLVKAGVIVRVQRGVYAIGKGASAAKQSPSGNARRLSQVPIGGMFRQPVTLRKPEAEAPAPRTSRHRFFAGNASVGHSWWKETMRYVSRDLYGEGKKPPQIPKSDGPDTAENAGPALEPRLLPPWIYGAGPSKVCGPWWPEP